MDFGFNKQQEMLRNTARQFLDREWPASSLREMIAGERRHSDQVWEQMADLGWMGLTFSEEYGGLGLGLVDQVVILEEMGRVLLPGPFFSSVVLAGALLNEAGSDAQKQEWLEPLTSGARRSTLALLEPVARWDAAGISARAERTSDGFRLNGTKLFVPDAEVADFILCVVRTQPGSTSEDGISLLVLDRNLPGLSITALRAMDQTRPLSELALNNVSVPEENLLGPLNRGWPIIQGMIERSAVALCAEMVGGAEKALEMSVDYAKSRTQFGRVIGSFQAIQHKCAEMKLLVESARSATYYAAWAIDNQDREASLAASMAKAYCSDAYRRVTAEAIQIHGGIGFSWEHDCHFYFKRAKSSEVTFGDAVWHRERIANHLKRNL